MTVKTYQASSMAEALAAVKSDLGRDAVIMQTRSVRKGGLLGLIGGRRVWEVTASASPALADAPPAGQYVPAESPQPAPPPGRQPMPLPDSHAQITQADGLRQDLEQLRDLVDVLVRRGGAPAAATDHGDLQACADLLRAQEVEDHLVEEILRELRLNLTGRQLTDPELIRARLRDLVLSRLPTAPTASAPGPQTERGRVIVLIGPTGVGKTTTIAKLAANYKLRENLRVGLITIDTYRIAAVEQLRTYAEIIDVSLRVVLSPAELRKAIYALRGMDVILLDTAGRSHNDQIRLSQLRRYLTAAEPDEVHLVVSAAASRGSVRRAVQRFGPLGVGRVILTKLDEAETFGTVLNVGATGVGEISYVTAGQEVPDDIAPADAGQLADWLLGGRFDARG